MMYTKQKITFFLFTLLAVVLCSNFENLDIDRLVSNEEQRKLAFGCLMDQAPCGEMQWLRDTIPEIIRTKCSRCTLKEKKKYDHVSKVLLEKYPNIFNALMQKYSPKNAYE